MKKFSNTINHSDKLMLTYFFRAVFIILYFKTKKFERNVPFGILFTFKRFFL